MKILITSDLFEATINGVVTSVKNLERELTAQGHEVKILTVSNSCVSYQKENVYYIMSVPSGIYPDIRIPVSRGNEYVRELIAWKPDVIHSQCEFFTFGYAKRIAKETCAVLLHTYHTLYEQYTEYIPIGKSIGRAALGNWMRMRLKPVNMIIAPTKKVEKMLREYEMEQDITVIPSGIEIQKFMEKENNIVSKEIREKYGIEEEKKVILSLGRLGFEKRIEELLFGMQEILKTRKDVILMIVGGGPARESLEKTARELGIEASVRFTGMVLPEETKDYYQMADIFACASTSETQGLTYIEAMASGLPLVCRKDDCLDGVLEEGKNGFTYETLEEFAAGIVTLINQKNVYENAVIRSRQIAEEFGTKRFGTRVESCYYHTLLKRRYEEYESFVICKEQAGRFKERCWARYGHARRIS